MTTGGAHSIALTTEGVLWIRGSNDRGELGISREASLYEPYPLPAKQFTCGQSIPMADLPIQGTDIKWYTASGSIVPNDLVLSAGNHLFGTQMINGLTSCRRLDVVGDTGFPLKPLGSQQQVFCSGAKVADLVPSGATIRWYATASGGMPLPADATLINGKQYYASGAGEPVNRRPVSA